MLDIKLSLNKNWDFNNLSYNKFNCDPTVGNRLLRERLNFNQDDLLKCIEHIKYKPGNKGYIETLNEYISIFYLLENE